MKVDSTPNNAKWGVAQTVLPNKAYYTHDEFNTFDLKNSKSYSLPSGETSGYSDGDLGSSLQEVKYAGTMDSSKIKKLVGVITKAGVTVVALASVMTFIQNDTPTITEPSIVVTGCIVEYSFKASARYGAELSISIDMANDETLALETRTIKANEENLFEGINEVAPGEFTFIVTYKGSFGSGTVYTYKGVGE